MLQSARNLVGQHLFKWPRQRLTAGSGASASWYDGPDRDRADRDTADRDRAIDERTAHYSQSRHLPVWESICERIPLGSRILEVGCGPAQFAHLLMDRKIPGSYVGFDLSTAAVAMARYQLPGSRVEVGDALTTDLFTSVDYDIVVCTEVLGGIVDDLSILGRIPREKQVLATVPDSDDVNNVRAFESTADVLSRYRCLFSSLEISQHHQAADRNRAGGTSFLLDGVR